MDFFQPIHSTINIIIFFSINKLKEYNVDDLGVLKTLVANCRKFCAL